MDHAMVKDELGLETLGTIRSEEPQAICIIAHMKSARKHADKRMMKMVLAKSRRRMASWHFVEAEHMFTLG